MWGEPTQQKDIRSDQKEKRVAKKAARKVAELTGLKTSIKRVGPWNYCILIKGEYEPQPENGLVQGFYKWWKIEQR
jgi:hypothetical protein